jgi:hypothetical protein
MPRMQFEHPAVSYQLPLKTRLNRLSSGLSWNSKNTVTFALEDSDGEVNAEQ